MMISARMTLDLDRADAQDTSRHSSGGRPAAGGPGSGSMSGPPGAVTVAAADLAVDPCGWIWCRR